MLSIRCPACNSREVRASLAKTLGERVARVFGFMQLRCKDCDERFGASIWDLSNVVYAKCPRCYRLDLSTWTTQYYRAPSRWLIAMKFGARRRRCEYCRHNFISWRPAKTKYRRASMAGNA